MRAKLVELWSRVVKLSDRGEDKNVYHNGDNNLYPNEIDRVINNSPIAVRAASIFAKYIAGDALREDRLVNITHGYSLWDIINSAGRSISRQGGAFIWVGYGLDSVTGSIVANQLEVLDYKKCRIGKEDDAENRGRVYCRDYEATTKGKEKGRWYYPFSSDQGVLLAQIRADYGRFSEEEFNIVEAIKTYRGQVYFLNMQPELIYPYSPFDSVYNDCDTDYRISMYNNTQTRNGFLGKVVMITQGLDGEAEEEAQRNLSEFIGSEGSGNIFLMNAENAEDVSNMLEIKQLKPQFDDKLFVETDKRNRRNILGCANNIPEGLIYAGEGALFGTNSDTYAKMKEFYWEQTKTERETLRRAVFSIISY